MIPLPSNRRSTRRFRISTLMLLAAIGLHWAAFRDVALHRALLPFMDLHAGHLAVFVLLNIAIIVVMCCRWKLILGRKGYAIGFHLLAAYRVGANASSNHPVASIIRVRPTKPSTGKADTKMRV